MKGGWGTIVITGLCNKACPHCCISPVDTSANMSIDFFRQSVDYLAQCGASEIRLLGGEPTCHPKFREIWEYVKARGLACGLATNGTLPDIISSVEYSVGDSILYNFDHAYQVDLSKVWECAKSATHTILIRIASNVDVDELLYRIKTFYGQIPDEIDCIAAITLDVTEDIIANRSVLNDKLRAIFPMISETKPSIPYRLDHPVPLCFWEPDTIRALEYVGIAAKTLSAKCVGYGAGVLDTDGRIYGCVDCRDEGLDISTCITNGWNAESMRYIHDHLWDIYRGNVIKCIDKGCGECEYFLSLCTGGCWMWRPFVKENGKWLSGHL